MLGILTILNNLLRLIPNKTITSAVVFAVTKLVQKYVPGVAESDVATLIEHLSTYGFNLGLFSWRLDEFLKNR
jgi:hypothetical protein